MDTHPQFTLPAEPALRVLIVDDMPQVRQDLRFLLQLSGEIEVVGEAANGLEAVERTAALRPDAVLMDLEMPVLDGYQAARQIKAASPACRVVAFSVHTYALARQKAAQSGADDFVEKGAPLNVILHSLKGIGC
jgi:DNA-binding NarL/FixJ family response regulator